MTNFLDEPENTFIAKAEEMVNSDKMIVSLFRIGITGQGKIFERWKHDVKCDDNSFKYMFTGKKLDDHEIIDLISTDDAVVIPMGLISSQSRDKKTCRFMQSITEYFFDTNNTPDDLRLIFESDKHNNISLTPQLHVSSIPINRNCRNSTEKLIVSVNMKHVIFNNNDDDVNQNTSTTESSYSLNETSSSRDNGERKGGDKNEDKNDNNENEDEEDEGKNDTNSINNSIVDTKNEDTDNNSDDNDDDDDDNNYRNILTSNNNIRTSGRYRISTNYRLLDSNENYAEIKKRKRRCISTSKDDAGRKCSKSFNNDDDNKKSPFIVFFNEKSNQHCYGKIHVRGNDSKHLVHIYELKANCTDMYFRIARVEDNYDLATELNIVPQDHFSYNKGHRAYKFLYPPEHYVTRNTTTSKAAKRSVKKVDNHNTNKSSVNDNKKRIDEKNNDEKKEKNITISNNTMTNKRKQLNPLRVNTSTSDYFGVVDEELSGIDKTWGVVIRGGDGDSIIWSRSKFNSPVEAAKAYDEYICTNDLENKYELNFKAKTQSINIFNMKKQKHIWFIEEKINKLHDKHIKLVQKSKHT